MLGAIGNDAEGKILIEMLQKAKVHTEAIATLEDTKTGLALIYVNNEGDNTIVVLPNANAKVDKIAIDAHIDLMHNCDIILFQMEIPEETLYYAIELAHSLGKTIILNPAPAPDAIPDNILSKIDYLTPNETELATLSGLPTDTLENIEKGAIATYLSQGKTIDEAIIFGNKTASITVTRVGAQSSIPSLDEVLQI